MKRVLLLLIAYVLAACGSKLDANEKNFGGAISKRLESKGNLCVSLNNNFFGGLDASEAQKKALEKAGLIAGSKIELTETGKKSFRNINDAKKFSGQINTLGESIADFNLCYGNVVLDKVEKWDMPTDTPVGKYSTVTFTVKAANIADWAMTPEIREAFPKVGRMIEAKGEYRYTMKLTNEGWESVD